MSSGSYTDETKESTLPLRGISRGLATESIKPHMHMNGSLPADLFPIRVLHLIPYMHPNAGGPPVVVDRWATQQRQLGCQVEVLTTNGYAGNDRSWVQTYAENYPIHVGRKRGPNGFGFSYGLRRKLLDVLPETDLVHVHNLWGYANQLAAKFCPRYDVPFVVSTHGMLDPHSVSRKKWKKRAYGSLKEWPALRKASGLIFTHQEEDRLARQSADKLPDGFVVPLATDEPPQGDLSAQEDAFYKRFPSLRDRRIVLFFGRLHSKKGLDLLIPAFAKSVAKNPDLCLVLAGPCDESYLSELRSLLSQHGIEDKALFTGSLSGDEKWGALSAADLFALPSYQENFAIAVVEAIRAGTPVLLSKRVNIWEDLVNAGVAMSTELNPESIDQQIRLMLSDPEKLSEMGTKGIQLAKNEYCWKRSAENLLRVYQEVLK
jgi:glycosyltransferase involved in cell wall biosynthesis